MAANIQQNNKVDAHKSLGSRKHKEIPALTSLNDAVEGS